jgi:hypothetical protein
MLAARILGYGPDYTIEIENGYGEKEKMTVDLSKVQTKEIDFSKINPENRYTFTTSNGVSVEFKMLTHGDETKIDADVKAIQRLNPSTSAELTTRYRYMITSVDGDSSTQAITKFVNNQFLTRDTRKFRELVKELQPDINLEFEYENPQTGEKEVRPIPMGVGFFWPSE